MNLGVIKLSDFSLGYLVSILINVWFILKNVVIYFVNSVSF